MSRAMDLHRIASTISPTPPSSVPRNPVPGQGVPAAGAKTVFRRGASDAPSSGAAKGIDKLTAGGQAARDTVGQRSMAQRFAALFKPGLEFLRNIKRDILRGNGAKSDAAARAAATQQASEVPKLRIREYQRVSDFSNFERNQEQINDAIEGRKEFFESQSIRGKEAVAALLMQSKAEVPGLDIQGKHLDASGWAAGNGVRAFLHLGLPNLLQNSINKTGVLNTNTQLASTQIALCSIAAAGVSPEFEKQFNAIVAGCSPDNFGDVIAKVQQLALDEYLKIPG